MTVLRCVQQHIDGTFEGERYGEKISIVIDAIYDVSTIQRNTQTVLFKLDGTGIGPNQLELWIDDVPADPETVIEELKKGRFYVYGLE
jgi:hypothetical protein